MTRTSGAWTRSVVLLIAAWSGSAPSEVTLDGSLGGAREPLPGPDFEIGADFGRQVGSNLFHSFGAFNLNASESATFSGPNAIKNILGRVTGGGGSNIDGLLRSTIPDANLFLLNPAGIVFGPSARLDVQGSFHASTGDFIRLADGRRFDAVPSANDALLTTKPPQAFGFLGRQDPAPIEVNGSILEVPDGKALSLIGGDIQVRGAQLIAPAGRVNLASVGAKAEVTLGPDDLGVETRSRGGAVTLSEGSHIHTSGPRRGSVFIRGGQFVMDSSAILSVSSKNGGVVSIEAKQVDLQNGASIDTTLRGFGSGGDILVDAGNVLLSGSFISTALGEAGGDAGNVTIKARDRFQMDDGAFITTSAIFNLQFESSRAGDVLVDAREVLLSSGSGILAGSVKSQGDGGNVTVTARDLFQMRDRAFISTTVALGFGRVAGGNVFVQAKRVSLSERSHISASLRFGEGEAGGNVTVEALDLLELRDGSSITASTSGSGPGGGILVRGGTIEVTADEIVLQGSDSGLFARAEGTAPDGGGGGDLTVNAGSLMVKEGATISASTFGPGEGGKLSITAADLELRDGASITSESISERPNAGRSGEIFIQATDSFRLFNDSQLSVETERADAGDIDLEVGSLLHLRDSSITTSVAGGQGDGGNIRIDPVFTVLEGSRIIAQAREGRGGNIRIVSNFFFGLLENVSASSERGIDGVVEIDSPETDLNAGLVPLPASFFDAAPVLMRPCAERSGADVIRLVVRPYEVLPDSPYALRVQRPKAPPGASSGWRGERDMATPAPLALGCLDGG